jgi:hypothetical protein
VFLEWVRASGANRVSLDVCGASYVDNLDKCIASSKIRQELVSSAPSLVSAWDQASDVD